MGTADVIPPRVPHGYADLVAYYGDPKPQRLSSGEWVVDPRWERDNLVRLAHPILPTTPCPFCHAPQSGHLAVHRLVIEPMTHCFDLWRARQLAGDPYRLYHVGCYAPRAQRNSTGLLPSVHTFAAAFDVNEHTNPLISPCELDDPRRRTMRDLPDVFISDAESTGAMSGTKFKHRSDGMHHQYVTGY